MRNSHNVYVVELHPDVLYEGKFRKSNPDYVPGKPCVYVGMTGLDRISVLTTTRPASRPIALCSNTACA